MHVRKGKLLAGDSGRKIAEVIDLQGAIYQRVAGGELCVWSFPFRVHAHVPVFLLFSPCYAVYTHVQAEKVMGGGVGVSSPIEKMTEGKLGGERPANLG